MKKNTRRNILILLAAVFPFFTQADFERLPLPPLTPGDSLPEGWSGHRAPHLNRIGGAHRVVEVEGQPVLQLSKTRFESVLMVHTEVDLPPGQSVLELGLRMRVPEIDLPEQAPGRNRFWATVVFLDADGEESSETFPHLSFGEADPDWTLARKEYQIPDGAERVRVALQMLNCVGIWEISAIGLRVKP